MNIGVFDIVLLFQQRKLIIQHISIRLARVLVVLLVAVTLW